MSQSTLTEALTHSVDQGSDRPAFRCGQQSLTYGQLYGRSKRLANCLVAQSVTRGDRVAILMPRCIESAVAVYGIMLSGGAFVPIDANAPAAFIADVMHSSGCEVVVTINALADKLAQVAREQSTDRGKPLRTVIGVDADIDSIAQTMSWSQVEQASDAIPNVSVSPDDLAYIVQTSGSTGRPKGIMHTHRSGLAYARGSAQLYQISPTDIIGSHAPLHTDMFTLGLLTGPYAGALTVIVTEGHLRMPASLCKLVSEEEISIWYSVPLALVQMLSAKGIDAARMPNLRWILYGGEPFAPNHLRELLTLLPDCWISNVYGPAETNQCTYFNFSSNALTSGLLAGDESVPIGKDVPGAHSLIVDTNDEPVNAGETGELVVHATTLMQGYWDQPELTQASFLARGIGNDQKQYYRTGDLARQQPDGNYLFAGRKDRQIKVRGFRVELDAIELALSEHPGVLEAAVFPVYNDKENTHMVCATVIASDSSISTSDLMQHAQQKLPEPARPARIEIVHSLPRTSSGKINRRALVAQSKALQES